MASKPHYTQQQMIDALYRTHGMVTLAAEDVGCHPQTLRAYVTRYPKVAEAIHDARERTTDLAEQALFKAITAGEPWAVALYLKTIGKGRGYVERQETQHSGPDGGPLALTVTVVDDRSA